MLENNIKYSYNDVTIVPAIVSNISHRCECIPFIEGTKLPIFTAPMSTVINENNFDLFNTNLLYAILPRSVNFDTRIDFLRKSHWVALSLQEFIDLFNCENEMWENCTEINVLIDIANGHMRKLYNAVARAKYIFKDKIKIMVGNIANPETYVTAYESGADYVRVGIGGGNGCFSKNTKISMADGSFKNIQDVIVGDNVKTLDGNKTVLSTKEIDSERKIIINDDIECTLNHKFLVINKKDLSKITDKNLMDYAFYLEAEKLNENEHLLVKTIVEFVEIKSKKILETDEVMYDFEVSENHQYIANNYVVHNCITSSNTGIHYPMASLINETFLIKKKLSKERNINIDKLPKIIADGGIRNYNDVIKALALGADYVMIGSLFASLFDSAASCAQKIGDNFIDLTNIKKLKNVNGKIEVTLENGNVVIADEIYKKFYGMASKNGQIDLCGEKNKTSEGITKYIKATTSLPSWLDNMMDYMKSAMSYLNITNIKDISDARVVVVSNNAYNSINK